MSNKNQYKQATRYFGIPVPGWKDGIWPELELLKWQMVENLLLAAMRGNVNAIFREGDFRISQESNGTYSVRLSATGNEPSAQGSVAGAYFDAPSSIVWSDLEYGKAYYLYVKGTTKTFQDCKEISPVASITRLTTQYATLIAKVDLTGETPSIDRNPPGKVNARDLAQHVLDYDNPHGGKLSQDEMLVRNHLAIGDGNDADLEFDVGGEISHFPLSRMVAGLKTTQKVVDFISGGSKGVVLTAGGRVVYASVVRTSPDDKVAGEIVVGFYGLSPKVVSPNQVVIWNSGEAGIAMRAMIVSE